MYQVISSNGETVEIFLDEPDTIADLEAVAQAGTGKRRPRVRVDLAGAEFFSMEEVASEFEPEDASKVASSSRTQLGYRTTEQVRRNRSRGRDTTFLTSAGRSHVQCFSRLEMVFLLRSEKKAFRFGVFGVDSLKTLSVACVSCGKGVRRCG